MPEENQGAGQSAQQQAQQGQQQQAQTGTQQTQEPDHRAEAEKWKALARRHEDTAKRNAVDAKAFRDAQQAGKSAEDRVAELERRTADAEQRALRLQVGSRKGLPAEMVDRLRGSTEDELSTDADELLKVLKPARPAGHADGGGSTSGAPAAATFTDWVRDQAGITAIGDRR